MGKRKVVGDCDFKVEEEDGQWSDGQRRMVSDEDYGESDEYLFIFVVIICIVFRMFILSYWLGIDY